MSKNVEDNIVKEIILDNRLIKVNHYEEETVNGLRQISIVFNVTSENITILPLYCIKVLSKLLFQILFYFSGGLSINTLLPLLTYMRKVK